MSEQQMIAFAVAAKMFFGLLPGQGLGQFVQECRDLAQDAKAELAELLTIRLHETGELAADKIVAA